MTNLPKSLSPYKCTVCTTDSYSKGLFDLDLVIFSSTAVFTCGMAKGAPCVLAVSTEWVRWVDFVA